MRPFTFALAFGLSLALSLVMIDVPKPANAGTLGGFAAGAVVGHVMTKGPSPSGADSFVAGRNYEVWWETPRIGERVKNVLDMQFRLVECSTNVLIPQTLGECFLKSNSANAEKQYRDSEVLRIERVFDPGLPLNAWFRFMFAHKDRLIPLSELPPVAQIN